MPQPAAATVSTPPSALGGRAPRRDPARSLEQQTRVPILPRRSLTGCLVRGFDLPPVAGVRDQSSCCAGGVDVQRCSRQRHEGVGTQLLRGRGPPGERVPSLSLPRPPAGGRTTPRPPRVACTAPRLPLPPPSLPSPPRLTPSDPPFSRSARRFLHDDRTHGEATTPPPPSPPSPKYHHWWWWGCGWGRWYWQRPWRLLR